VIGSGIMHSTLQRHIYYKPMAHNDDLLASIASLYYLLNQSQGAIAKRLDLSTSKVSRLLKEARDKGIVDIRIHMPIPRDIHLEQMLVDHFGLKDAYVLQTTNDASQETRLSGIGKLAAGYVQNMLETIPVGGSIGVAWGRGVHSAVTALPDAAAQNIDVVPLIGGVGTLVVDSPDVTRIVAQKLGGRHYDLHAPILVERSEVRELFLAEPTVHLGIQRAQTVDLAITGIGTVMEEGSSFLRAGLLSRVDLAHLRKEGVVGELCGHFFDIGGNYQRYAINQRIIGLDLEQLKKVRLVLAVANGLSKTQAIYGALNGGYINVLTTDDITARSILAMAEEVMSSE
jgi:deoxyribonucleoside regulator